MFDTFCFPPLAGNCKNTDLGGRRRINDGVNYKKKFEIGKKKCQEALILAVKYRRFAHRLKLMNNVLLFALRIQSLDATGD